MIIVIEGPDGSGKSTLAKALAAKIGARTVVEFPDRSTLTGREIDRQLREGVTDPIAFQCLQLVNKAEHDFSHYADHLEDHAVLVRWWQSAWVYGALDGIPSEWTEGVCRVLPQGDLNILLDPPEGEIAKRRAARGGKAEYYETTENDRRIVSLYRDLWDREDPSWVRFCGYFTVAQAVEWAADELRGQA